MRVTSITLTPDGSTDVITLSFKDPTRQNPYNVKSISGLDASDGIVPLFYGNSGDIGSSAKFYNLSIQKREPVISIALNPSFSLGKSYSDLRDDLYKAISSSRTGLITMAFINETGIVAELIGFASKLEAVQFAKDPTVNLTLSAVDPMLKAPAITPVNVIGLDPSNILITDSDSTAPHGFSFAAVITAALASIVITDANDPLGWSFTITPVGGFLNNDVLRFSSDPNDKELFVVRGGVNVYLADVITPGSVWPIIFPGDNRFSFTNPTHLNFTSISYNATYWGV